MKRRDFVALSAAAALPLSRRWTRSIPPITPRALPFDLSRIRLLPGRLYDEMQINRKFLLGQDPDRLLHTFRLKAGLPSSAEPLGGWEAPINELRGHYTGHYLSACALMAAQGDRAAEIARVRHAR